MAFKIREVMAFKTCSSRMLNNRRVLQDVLIIDVFFIKHDLIKHVQECAKVLQEFKDFFSLSMCSVSRKSSEKNIFRLKIIFRRLIFHKIIFYEKLIYRV